jgi:hypothetical protein
MTLVAPGTCRHCRCTEDNACRLAEGETCSWMDRTRTVCSSPSCIKAESLRVARIPKPKRLTSADVNALIRGRGRKRSREKGRAA